MSREPAAACGTIEISELDIVEAMREIEGYIDISPGDFREIFHIAYRHALRRLSDSRTAADIMVRPVQCVSTGMDLIQTATFLAEKQISGAPVIAGDGRIVGVVSEKDFLAQMGVGGSTSFMQIIAHCLHNRGCIATLLRNHHVDEIMTAPAITAPAEATLTMISALFREKKINRLPIVDSAGKPIGIVTRTDLVHASCSNPTVS
jgi:CBS domain-containing membrane protein